MKYLPIAALETLNSMLTQQPAPSCLVSIRTDAFSCRKSKDDKRTALAIRGNSGGAQLAGVANAGDNNSGEVMGDSFGGAQNNNNSFGDAAHEGNHQPQQQQQQQDFGIGVSPFDHIVGNQPQFPSTATGGGGGANVGGSEMLYATTGGTTDDMGLAQHQQQQQNPEDILLFLVSTLNAIHGQEYDFSVLGFEAFEPFPIESHDSPVISDVNSYLTQLHNNPVSSDAFWRCVNESLRGLLFMGDCQGFLLNSPNCDPLVQRYIFPKQYFIYCRKLKVMISIQCYGEGNAYRGDDGMNFDGMDEDQYNMCDDDDGDDDEYWGKNRGFYGFGGDSY